MLTTSAIESNDYPHPDEHRHSKGALLSDGDLLDLIEQKKLGIEPFNPDCIKSTSIDLQLGPTLVRYTSPQTIRLDNPDAKPEVEEIDITDSVYTLHPGEFILGMTKESVFIPNGYQGFIETKGNIARAGLQAHCGDGHIDPGFFGHITLEISNMHRGNDVSIQIIPGIYICQLFIFRLTSECKSVYKGKYSGYFKPSTYLP